MYKNIFLAEDDPDDQFLFTDALKQIDSSIECQIAANGKETISLLKKLESLPDIIFLDLNMPLMNGFECLSKIKNDENLREIPIVIFTTSSNPEDIQATHQLGANVYFSKPAGFIELKDKIEKILNLVYESTTVPAQAMIAQYYV
ncbi:MAG: response regulator [Bacteroidota bacterium]